MNTRRGRRPATDAARQHRDWLALVEISGPFLSLPVLRATWPSLDAIEPAEREELRRAHVQWRDDPARGQQAWIGYLLQELLGWRDELRTSGLDPLTIEVAEHDTTLAPSFALVEPGTDADGIKPADTRLLGMVCEPATQPTARIRDSAWAATPVDRLAQLCRHHDVPLGLATDGRWWALVWAPRGGVTTTAVFDSVGWAEAAERDVLRAFRSLLGRTRFFGVPENEQLLALLAASKDSQEDITEALGVQVRQAVELLVAAIGRADVRDRAAGGPGLAEVSAHDVYRGAVSVMMRVVFLLFAEERRLLPSDNELYAAAYSAGRLCAELEQRALEGTEEELENSHAAWHRLLALFAAVHSGIDHPRLRMHAHDGSLFDPAAYPWLPLAVDDRTVLHMLHAVQYVEIGTGRNRERRTLSFRQLDVEQIGYVYEGLLSFEGFRADGVVVGLIGKQGLEEEVTLTSLEALAGGGLAAALAEKYKPSGIGSVAALTRRLAPLDAAAREDARKKLLAVTDGDYPLAERLLPFFGVLRRDLRDLPAVILPGALYVTESKLRKNTGTHYTPRELAEDVVKHALEPLLYHRGPLETPDKSQWTYKRSDELLTLKVADIAMGSAAFLVAAARYLGAALLDAWAREGKAVPVERDATRPPDADEDPLVIDARRQIIEQCLYGVDINPMAVEMAKLSLWLVSMDPKRPFTFLDDRLVAGDSLLGITNLEQLEYLHMDPARGREIHSGDLLGWTAGLRFLVSDAAAARVQIANMPVSDDEPLKSLAERRRLLAESDQKMAQLRFFADLAVGAALARAGCGANALATGSITAARLINDTWEGGDPEAAQRQRDLWLRTNLPRGAFDRCPLHWPLVFSEVFETGGGFDAVIGNPPFLGGKKISGATGSAYREYLVDAVGGGVKGNADLIAYFALRAHSLLNKSGQTGLLGTNTLAQGDTREVGLDQLVGDGVTIRRSIKSEPWPARSAALQYCCVWASWLRPEKESLRILDGVAVPGITTKLDRVSRVDGEAYPLVANRGRCFVGNFVNGTGFVLDRAEALAVLRSDEASSDVVRPYLIGSDLNSQRDLSATRYIISFGNRSYEQAAQYPALLERVRREVKPARDKLPDSKKTTREKWWQFEKLAPGLHAAISDLNRVAAMARVSKTLTPVIVPTGQVMSEAVIVFATSQMDEFAILSSAPHYCWAVSRVITRGVGAAPTYAPADVYETFPLPNSTHVLRDLGDRLDTFRGTFMLARNTGLTKTYNLVFDPSVHDDDIVELRRIHREIDRATVRAYGWDDLLDQLDHGFHPAGRDLRYTIGPAAQREILDRLLELNHERYAQEVAQGLHNKKGRKATASNPSDGALF